MRTYFSKRHEMSLKDKKIVPVFSPALRTAIWRILTKYSEGDFEDYTLSIVEETLKTFYGEDPLRMIDFGGKYVKIHLREMVINGIANRIPDVVEAWCDCAVPENKDLCEKALNSIFEIHNTPWRIVNSIMILVDPNYLHDEVVAKSIDLMRENGMTGALEEFTDAVSSLTAGRTKDAVNQAHKSVESVMKTVLGIEKRMKFDKLLKMIIKSGMIPTYYEDFVTHFEKLVGGAKKERYQPGPAHGQGARPREVPRSLAEFVVHLAGAINVFMIKRWIEYRPSTDVETPF